VFRDSLLFVIIKRMRLPMYVLIITFSISILGLVLIPGVDNSGNSYHLNFFDAFYIVSYTATTIGFGELPYKFTYFQRLWLTLSIYMTVIGWLYAIGAIIVLIQDRVFAAQIALTRFKKKVENISEPFIIFIGYNSVTKAVIKKLSKVGIRSVVIEKDENRIDDLFLDLQNYSTDVPALSADIKNPKVFTIAGIHKQNCKAVVSLFNNDQMNLYVTISVKIMNKNVKVIAEATKREYEQHLKTVGADVIENPFGMVAKHIYLSLKSPSLLTLKQWMHGEPLVLRKKDRLPKKGKYVICGYGRMGSMIEIALNRAGIDYIFIEKNSSKIKDARVQSKVLHGDATDKKTLYKAKIHEAACVIAATKDDLLNLSIILTSKRMNPNIFTIARENNLDDTIIFTAAKIDRIIMFKTIVSKKTYNIIARPLLSRFVKLVEYRGEEWGDRVVNLLKEHINNNPETIETVIDDNHAYALVKYLKEEKEEVPYSILYRRRDDYTKNNSLLVLYIKRGSEEILLPDPNIPIQIGDEVLIAGTKDAFEDVEYIMENIYELYYVLKGKECELPISQKLKFNFKC